MINIILQGIHGRMGKTILELVRQRDDCRIAAGIDAAELPSEVPVFPSLEACNIPADVLIDFSTASATAASLPVCAQRALPCVICTTGLSPETEQLLQTSAQSTAVFKSANMSLGINVLIALAKQANAILGNAYDIEIIEKHHHNKLDAPSGTALMIADALNEAASEPYEYVYDRHNVRQKRAPREMGLHAVRGGSIVGEHEVLFCGPDEVITLSHSAASRGVFANGALNAALFLAGKPAGLYSMKDLIDV